jgi:hypothetical protein
MSQNKGLTADFLGAPVLMSSWFRRSIIRSIQRGTIELTGANLTATATITTVDTANTRLVLLGLTNSIASASDFRDNWARISLTNATTVTATRLTASDVAVSLIVSYEVIDVLDRLRGGRAGVGSAER